MKMDSIFCHPVFRAIKQGGILLLRNMINVCIRFFDKNQFAHRDKRGCFSGGHWFAPDNGGP